MEERNGNGEGKTVIMFIENMLMSSKFNNNKDGIYTFMFLPMRIRHTSISTIFFTSVPSNNLTGISKYII